MEKDYRLFVRNLPPDIDDNTLKNLFKKHGQVTKIDVKEKIQNDGTKIAFINLTTTDRKLNTCFQDVNGAIVNGYSLSVEVAKESFLDRLKREREEAAKREAAIKEPKKVLPDQPIERINIKAPDALRTKSTKRIYDFDDFEKVTLSAECAKEPNDTANCFRGDPALEIETAVVKKPKKSLEQLPQKLKSDAATFEEEKKVINQSEIKRLASLKQKREAFKAKELLISNSLKDSTRKNNKVIFSDNIEEIGNERKTQNKCLFNDEEDDEVEEAEWSDDKFQHDEKRAKKLAMSLNNLGRDKRFVMDDRFLDHEETESKPKDDEKYDEDDLQNEKKWQMNILENVLGKPLAVKEDKVGNTKKKMMVRYDPTEKSHRSHELEITPKISAKAGKRKRAANETEPEEETPLPVSSDVFYSVSENLTESLKVQGEFSLLKTFGTATTADKNRSDDYAVIENATQQQKYQRNFDVKDPFKYESSDEEYADNSLKQLDENYDSSAKNNKSVKKNNDFFFDAKDQRFSEAEEFFKTPPSITQEFKNVRRELKQIVRSKIRNNVKRNTPWRNKKIGTKPKIH